jgi:hypothetical protein
VRIKETMIVASVGQYGPFDDGKTVPFVELLDPSGGGVFRATASSDATGTPPAVATQARVDLELYIRDGRIKCRYHSITAADAAKAA